MLSSTSLSISPIPIYENAVIASKRIELTFSLLDNGRLTSPPSKDGFREIPNLFPTAYAVEAFPPFLIVRVRTLPPKPWLPTLAGMPLRLTTGENDTCFNRGRTGRGGEALVQWDLRKEEYSERILKAAITFFLDEIKSRILNVAWFCTFWLCHYSRRHRFQGRSWYPHPSILWVQIRVRKSIAGSRRPQGNHTSGSHIR